MISDVAQRNVDGVAVGGGGAGGLGPGEKASRVLVVGVDHGVRREAAAVSSSIFLKRAAVRLAVAALHLRLCHVDAGFRRHCGARAGNVLLHS